MDRVIQVFKGAPPARILTDVPDDRKRHSPSTLLRRTLTIVGVAAVAALAIVFAVVLRSGPPTTSQGRVLGSAGATATVLGGEGSENASPPPARDLGRPGIDITGGFTALDLPDPFIYDDAASYDLFLSTAFADPARRNIPVLRGRADNWVPAGDALPLLPPWATGPSWAPEIHKFGDRYVMYYSPVVRNTVPTKHCIATAVSEKPAGPYFANGQPFICQPSLGGDIDAQVYVDPAGPNGPSEPNYLIWKSDNNSTAGAGSTTIWAQTLSDDGLSLTGLPHAIYMLHLPWQVNVVEAPQMVKAPTGKLYLFYSAGPGFGYAGYAMGVATCSSVFSPCTDVSATPFIAQNEQGTGPGEETVFRAADGSVWLLYNPWPTGIPGAWARPVEAARIGFSPEGPYVAEAGTFPAPGAAPR